MFYSSFVLLLDAITFVFIQRVFPYFLADWEKSLVEKWPHSKLESIRAIFALRDTLFFSYPPACMRVWITFKFKTICQYVKVIFRCRSQSSICLATAIFFIVIRFDFTASCLCHLHLIHSYPLLSLPPKIFLFFFLSVIVFILMIFAQRIFIVIRISQENFWIILIVISYCFIYYDFFLDSVFFCSTIHFSGTVCHGCRPHFAIYVSKTP